MTALFFDIIITFEKTDWLGVPGNLKFYGDFSCFTRWFLLALIIGILLIVFVYFMRPGTGSGAGSPSGFTPYNFNVPDPDDKALYMLWIKCCIAILVITGCYLYGKTLSINFHVAQFIMSEIGQTGRFANIFDNALNGLLCSDDEKAFEDFLEICKVLSPSEQSFFLLEFNKTFSNFGHFSSVQECGEMLKFYKRVSTRLLL